MDPLTMTRKERQKLDTLHRMDREELSRLQASALLGLSVRQVYRLYRQWQAIGDRAVVHRARGGHSARGYPLAMRNQVIGLYRSSYSDYGPTLFSEELQRQYGLRLHRETVRRWLQAVGLWHPGEQGRRRRQHRRARPRRAACGSLLQLDGSTHDWFEGRNPELREATLLVAIDDASSRVQLRFRPSEDTQGVFELLDQYARQYGLPQSIYTDYGSVYWTEAGTTQYQRAMSALGIATIYAHSPQAKGRVERTNRTLQDRLIKAMRQQGIRTIEQANAFLESSYIADHNARFAKGHGLADVHRSTIEHPLERALCMEEQRTLLNDYTLQIAATRWQVEKPTQTDRLLLPSPGARITVRVYLDQSVHAFAGEQELRITQVADAANRLSSTPGRRPQQGNTGRQTIRKRLQNSAIREAVEVVRRTEI